MTTSAPPTGAPADRSRATAVGAMLLSAVLFAAMAMFAKMAGRPVAGNPMPAAEVALFRWAFGLIVLLPLHGRWGIDLLGKDRVGLFKRGLFGGFAVYAYFLAIENTSLSHAVLLNYTSLIFAPLFAVWMLRERVSSHTLTSIAVAMGGILLITRNGAGVARLAGDLFGLLSGFLSGAAITEIRRLRQAESAWSIFFYLCLVGLPISLIACLAQRPVWPAPIGWAIVLVMGACSVGGQLLMTYGYRYVRAAEGGVITLSQVVYSALAGWLWFSEPITAHTLIGGGLILVAVGLLGKTKG